MILPGAALNTGGSLIAVTVKLIVVVSAAPAVSCTVKVTGILAPKKSSLL